jgi:hypothetical protein
MNLNQVANVLVKCAEYSGFSTTKLLSYLFTSHLFSLRVKRPGREADHSPPSSAEVKE